MMQGRQPAHRSSFSREFSVVPGRKSADFIESAEEPTSGCSETYRVLPWHRRSSYEPDAPARGVPQGPRWRVGLVCAKDAKLSCRGNSQALEVIPSRTQSLIAFPDIPLKSAIIDALNLRSAHPPDIILEYPPAGHRIVDEWHYAETRCAPSAAHGGILPPPPRGISDCDRQDPHGSVMVHVTTTLRLAPTHSFLESSPTKVSQPAHREFREFFTETTST